MTGARLLPVPDGLDGERVDVALARLLGLSRARAAQLAGDGAVRLDGRPVGKSDRLLTGSLLEVDLPTPPGPPDDPGGGTPGQPDDPPPSRPSERALTVRFEDDDLVVVDKPVGMAAHPSPGWEGPTVVGTLAGMGRRIATSGAAERQGVVHRLDVGTSGLMAVAKSERAYADLKEQFRSRRVEKTYHALVQGHPDPTTGTIDAPVGRHPTQPHRWAVVSEGRHAVTHYATLEAFPAATLLTIRLETGRTHQIRVHLSALRHPCVGDLTYGADPVLARSLGLTRQWLHAVELGFAHPATGEWTVVTSTYPDDVREALERL